MYKLLFVLLVIAAIVGFIKIPKKDTDVKQSVPSNDHVVFSDEEYAISFTYPSNWGKVLVNEGNKICPQEDTYRTQDTLNIYDREYAFSAAPLSDTKSFIRTGIRIYKINPSEECQNDLLKAIVSGAVNPQTISSVKLDPIYGGEKIIGIYNGQASRLNTEYRIQYTYFEKNEGENDIIIQSYFSFIPVFNSKELKEIEEVYKNDINRYVNESPNAQNIRSRIQEFKELSESLRI